MMARSSDRADASGRLLSGFVLAVLALAVMAALGFRANVTLGSMLVCVAMAALRPSLWPGRHSVLGLPSIALLVFMASAIPPVLHAKWSGAFLPPAYFLHAMALIILCPLAYGFGLAATSAAPAAWVERTFKAALALEIGFVALTFLAPGLLSDDEMVRGSYYQYSGDCLAMLALVHLAFRRDDGARWPLLVALPILVLVGSRASLACYAVALMVSPLLGPLLLLLAGIGLAWFLAQEAIAALAPEFFEASRVVVSVLGAAFEGAEDASLLERQEFQQSALQTIRAHPLMGEFGYDFINNGYVGGFAHSALDLWAQYGLLNFLAFVAMICLLPVWRALSALAQAQPGQAHARYVPLLVFLILQFSLFRHPESVVLFFGIGALAALVERPRLPKGRLDMGRQRRTHRSGYLLKMSTRNTWPSSNST